jgi:hypothetical protein
MSNIEQRISNVEVAISHVGASSIVDSSLVIRNSLFDIRHSELAARRNQRPVPDPRRRR